MNDVMPIAVNTLTPVEDNTNDGNATQGKVCEICDGIVDGIDGFNIYIYVGQLLLAMFMATFNVLTTVAIYRCHAMTSSIRVSLLNLSITDVLTSLAFGYHVALTWFATHEVTVECYVRYTIFVGLTVQTQMTITFVSTDRFLSIAMTYRYQRFAATTKYIKISLCTIWLYTVAWTSTGFSLRRSHPEACFYPLLVRPVTHLLYASASTANIIYIICLNVYLLIYAKRQIKKIAPTLVGMTSEERAQEMARMSIKSITTTLSVVVPFLLLNTPMYLFFFYLGLDSTYGHTWQGLLVTNVLSSAVTINSLVNPFIYVWRWRQVRAEVKKMLRPLLQPCSRK